MYGNLELGVSEKGQGVARAIANEQALVLLNDDRNYFRAGANVEVFDKWRLIHTSGFLDLAASCVLEPPPGATDVPTALARRLNTLGVSTIRFYQPASTSKATSSAVPFETIQEIAYLIETKKSNLELPNADLVVRPLRTDEDDLKVALYESRDGSPDGKPSNPKDYVALERRKIDAGYMQGFIVEDEGVPAACFGLSVTTNLVRMKNLLTSGDMRGRGCGHAIVHFAIEHARQHRKDFVGVFAIEGGGGQRLYERCGLTAVARQTEFSAPTSKLLKATH